MLLEDQATASLLDQQSASDLHLATAHYLSLSSDRQQLSATADEQATFQASLQHLASTFALPHTS